MLTLSVPSLCCCVLGSDTAQDTAKHGVMGKPSGHYHDSIVKADLQFTVVMDAQYSCMVSRGNTTSI